MLSLKI